MTHPYASAAYAQAFAPGMEPVYLPETGSWVLKRSIPGTDFFDAMGCYPLTPIHEQAALEKDFELLQEAGLVSLVLVTDPFFRPSPGQLETSFDKAAAYKEHYINDFSLPELYESKNHRYKVRRALRDCEVRVIDFAQYLDKWCVLYDALIIKHNMRGVQAFSHEHFVKLCALPVVAIGAFSGETLISCQLWLAHGDYVYSHLVASSEQGYSIRAAYAVYDFSLRHFAGLGAKMIDFGSGAGVSESSGGLAMIKKGFSTQTAMCYLCTKILDRQRYDLLSAGKNTSFFPAYRG